MHSAHVEDSKVEIIHRRNLRTGNNSIQLWVEVKNITQSKELALAGLNPDICFWFKIGCNTNSNDKFKILSNAEVF